MATRFTLLLLSICLLLSSSAPSGVAAGLIQGFISTVSGGVSKGINKGLNTMKKDPANKLKDAYDIGDKFAPHLDFNTEPPPEANLVRNGGFEVLSPLGSTPSYPGWSTKFVRPVDVKHFKGPFGNYAVELFAGGSELSQLIKTTPNKDYALSFIVGDAKNDCLGNMTVVASAAGGNTNVQFNSVGEGHTEYGNLPFRAVGPTTQITFYSANFQKKNDRSLCGPVIDAVRVVPFNG